MLNDALLCYKIILQTHRQRCERNFLLLCLIGRILECAGRQSLFCSSANETDTEMAQNTQRQIMLVFPNALHLCLCVYKRSRERANIMKSNSWRIICEKHIHSPLCNPPYSESLLKKGKILPTFLLSMVKPSWLQQCSTPIFPPFQIS